MNRNYSVICYIVSYILSMTCMPALATACWITDTMIQQRGDVLVVWQLPAIILSVLAIVQQERKQDRTLAIISLLYAFILALFIGVIVLMCQGDRACPDPHIFPALGV